MTCRLLLVDDHPALSRGLARLLSQEPDLEIVNHFATGKALLAFLAAAPEAANLLLLDPHLPQPHHGVELLAQLRHEWPELRILIFVRAATPVLMTQMAAAGAQGFLHKSAEMATLLSAIRAVHLGQWVFPASRRKQGTARSSTATPEPVAAPEMPLEVLLRLRQLSGRERQVISLVREGLSTRAIARRLALAELTVSTHRRNLMHKLQVHGVAELMRLAHDCGL